MVIGEKDKKRTAPDPGNALFIFYVGFVMVISFLAMLVDAHAGTKNSIKEISLSVPHRLQDVEVSISGLTARAMARQQFVDAADQLQMKTGDRTIANFAPDETE
ncbi:MAG: hypothetical protein JKY62_12980 [Desulfocapsa sp.]|uniref:Motility protein B-like N-terminal domain-containing protein n=1 Tax=Desulfotalea psychrophila TaxID=84980 RepID=A0ABS3AUM7_9BACT|nr:hypothetical protein [Desulfocapsa sp.]MBN4060005.1 hypothetical protein [Desulfotalea psychrophila]MBN4068220.1 hypothetical protein [Desulfotalea psychrophila]